MVKTSQVVKNNVLAIARALARKPEIIIFDDSFSALDYKTDRILRSQLKERTADNDEINRGTTYLNDYGR